MPVIEKYSITDLQDEVRALVARGAIGRQQRIYELSQYFDDREWGNVEKLLSLNDYLLRDCVIDLVGKEAWISD